MARRFKKAAPLGRHYVKEWRKYRGLSQDAFADRVGMSKATLSRIENGIIPYGQGFLETCAEILECTTGDLTERSPLEKETILSIWERIPLSERDRALEVLKAFTRIDEDVAAE
jgi:transcriptional regulator with XRE-family HTH domain